MLSSRTFPGHLNALVAIRRFLEGVAAEAGIAQAAAYGLCLAVEEIVSNAIIHGYDEAGLRGDLYLTARLQNEALVVTLQDNGRPYDFGAVATAALDLEQPLAERPIGGLGIFLARKSVDELRYESTSQGNIHEFIVKLQSGRKW